MHGPPHALYQRQSPGTHELSILPIQAVRGAVDALLELGYDPSMKGRLLSSTVSMNVLCRGGAVIRRTAEVLTAAGIAPRVARHGLRLDGKPLAAVYSPGDSFNMPLL
jgi:hypothetical protein